MSTAQLLQAAGLRHTKAREIVLTVLHQVDRPLSHQEMALESEIACLDRVTLYRTLATLERAGLLHRIQDADGVWRFRGHGPRQSGKCGGNHIHFLCLTCNQMVCLPEQPLPWVTAPPGGEILGKQLVVYGRCSDCSTGLTNRGRGAVAESDDEEHRH